jgi:hypothetical protein
VPKFLRLSLQQYSAVPMKFYREYKQANLYDSSDEPDLYNFEDATNEASDLIGDDPGIFQKIFLFVTGNPNQVFRLYPR